MNEKKEQIIRNYIEGYNTFDVAKMTLDFDWNIVFENVQNGETTLSLKGIEAFRQQAEQGSTYFSERKQRIKSFEHSDNSVEIEIDYHAVLAMDFPNGLKKGQELNLSGRSVFVFDGEKIIRLTDIS